MSTRNEDKKAITRRDFVGKGGLVAGAITVAALPGESATAANEKE